MLPNFLIIGAAKSGTSSLWSYLRAHPEVFVPEKKELDFFCDPDWRSGLAEYKELFSGATEPLRGEASVYYSMHPFKPGVAAAIADVVPDAKLIYLVRDPIPRAVAHYVQNVAAGYEDREIDEAFEYLDDPGNEYVCSSRYATQLREYLARFDREQILVLDQSTLLNDRIGTLRRIFGFLGVDEGFVSPEFEQLANTRSRLMRQTALGLRIRQSALAGAVRRLPGGVGEPVSKIGRRIFFRRIPLTPALDPAVERHLAGLLRPEVAELRNLTGLELGSWTIDGAELETVSR